MTTTKTKRCSGDYPIAQCPECRTWHVDMDGFGVLKCDCGYCSHPSASGSPMRCDLCERLVEIMVGD